MNTSGKGLVALYLHKRGEQWMVQQIKVVYCTILGHGSLIYFSFFAVANVVL